MPDNSNRNTVIFVVLAFLMLMAYQVFVMGPQAKRREAELKARQGEQAQVVPGAKALDQTQVYLPRAKVVGQSPRLQIDTPSVSGSLSLRGARIDDLFLKGYRETVDPKSPAVELLRPEGAKFAWFAEFGWTGANLPGLPTPDTVWTLVEGQVLSPGKPVVLRYDNGQGLVFTRKIEVDNKFMFTVSDTVANTTGAVLNLTPYGSIQRQGVPVQANGATAHEGALGVLDKELRLIKYKAWKKDGEKNFSSDGGWLGIT
ncbi:MAG TPA: membrane protein insertase YidC, partial [Phenylobacterium sp.]|nr:membrane protein insertase YidC [Phenylobacterium sp.]